MENFILHTAINAAGRTNTKTSIFCLNKWLIDTWKKDEKLRNYYKNLRYFKHIICINLP
jgi:hypothetical protein